MSFNVMEEYTKLTKKYILEYLKIILEKKYDKQICTDLLEYYMEVRYYDLNENKLYKKIKNDIIENINIRKTVILKRFPEKENIIEVTAIFFNYILYLDDVVPYKDIDKVIENIDLKRREILNEENEQFKQNITEKIKECIKDKEAFFDKFNSKEFYLKISAYQGIAGVQRVNLKYDFKLPNLYNSMAIEKAFTTGIIAEDKLFVEYYLISKYIIQDIIKGNFKKQYIVEFSETILKKNQKNERLLNIINNAAIQDKLSLKIKYKTYIENKEIIQNLMKNGYKFSTILDENFEVTYGEIEKLKMFKYILINKDYRYQEEIIRTNKEIKDRIIEI